MRLAWRKGFVAAVGACVVFVLAGGGCSRAAPREQVVKDNKAALSGMNDKPRVQPAQTPEEGTKLLRELEVRFAEARKMPPSPERNKKLRESLVLIMQIIEGNSSDEDELRAQFIFYWIRKNLPDSF